MEPKPNTTPLIVIVGETASGKTALAIKLAKKFNGEIIAADSRTIYRGMDIGTAKPTIAERDGIEHHLVDIISPVDSYSAAQFKQDALKAIDDIEHKRKLPIIVGGSGLYIDAILYDFAFGKEPDLEYRSQLQKKTVDELQKILIDKGVEFPRNDKNPRHLIRAIENGGVVTSPRDMRANTLVIGLSIDREKLHEKLKKRVDAMIASGLLDEVRELALKYGWDAPALQSTSYRAFQTYFDGQNSLAEAKEMFVRNDMQLAKRQRTWFKRNKSIHWMSEQDNFVDLVTTFLNK